MIETLSIRDLRVIQDLRLDFSRGINVVTGSNGAGKTSILEGIYLLSRGRSFRHRESAPLLREGALQLEIVAVVHDRLGGRHVLGQRRGRGEVTVRLDGLSKVRRSEILRVLPVHWIGADTAELVAGEPKSRRNFIDAGMFHVEPPYLDVLQRYQRVLDQRNASLRRGQRDFYIWDDGLGAIGTEIDERRRTYLKALEEKILFWLGVMGTDVTVNFSYRPGWKRDCDLGKALREARGLDERQRFTSCGPHRADWVMVCSSHRSGKVLSRGQMKMLASACYLAQADMIRERGEEVPVLLYDDLPSELDKDNRGRLLKAIAKIYEQAIVTALAPGDLPLSPVAMFHVEHGCLTPAPG